MNIEEKIRLIDNSTSFADVPADALPPSYKDNYYFVSYSHKDYKVVLKDILRLEELGVNIWYDKEMHIGENWQEIAQLYISKFQCAGVIFYLTPNSVSSPACNREVEYVLTHDKKFISINTRIDGESFSGYGMLKNLVSKGMKCDDALLDNFRKAFSDEILYLDIDENVAVKADRILSIPRESLFKTELVRGDKIDKYVLSLTECRDNTILSADTSKRYEADDGNVYNIVKIDDCVFTNSVKLTRVVVPDTLKRIGENAFRNCHALTDIDLSATSDLEIGNSAFRDCESITDIDLGRVSKIGEYAFKGCSGLKKADVSGAVYGFAFYNSGLKSLRLISPTLYRCALFGARDLETVTIDGTFSADLGDSAFCGCRSLVFAGPFVAPRIFNDQTIKSLKIGRSVFEDCEKLEEITFSGGWETKNADGAFAFCRTLKKITLDVPSDIIPDKFAMECNSLQEIEGDGFTYIGESAFEECKSLESFDFSSVKYVGRYAFKSSGLKRVYLADTSHIEEYAFYDMPDLRYVVVGEGCKHIGKRAFMRCPSLHTVKLLFTDAKVMEEELFAYSVSIATLYVRSVEVYSRLKAEGVLENVNEIYFGDNVDVSRLKIEGFSRVTSDEDGYFRYLRDGVETECEKISFLDIDSEEANAVDKYHEKFSCRDVESYLGKTVILKNRRLYAPYECFVEEIALAPDGSIDYLVVSVHRDHGIIVDGTVIESLELSDAVPTSGIMAAADDIVGKNCSIVTYDDFIYCVPTAVRTVTSGSGATFADAIYYLSDDDTPKAVSGEDVVTLTVFTDDFLVERVYEKEI